MNVFYSFFHFIFSTTIEINHCDKDCVGQKSGSKKWKYTDPNLWASNPSPIFFKIVGWIVINNRTIWILYFLLISILLPITLHTLAFLSSVGYFEALSIIVMSNISFPLPSKDTKINNQLRIMVGLSIYQLLYLIIQL